MNIIDIGIAKNNTKKSLLGQGSIQGQPGKDGKDAPTITRVDVNENNVLLITLSDGTTLTGGTIQTVFGKNGIDGLDGRDGQDGITPHIDPVTKHWFIDTTDTGIVAEGKDGINGSQGIQGAKGEKGDDGYPFLIYKEYDSLSEFNSNDFPEIGLLFTTKRNEENNIPVYRYTGEKEMPYSFITNLSENEGIKGEKGEPGKDGIGILNIEKTSTDGLVDTYTITYSDYSTSTFNVTNGKSDDKNVDLSNYLTKEELSELLSKIDYSALKNNPMVGATVAVAVSIEEAAKAGKF